MTALDTNVLVRFLVKDDAAQAKKAKALIDRLEEAEERAYVSDVVLCELVWVLSRSYEKSRGEIARALDQLAAARQLRFERPDQVVRATRAYATGRGDFADYLIREHARAATCHSVKTFDKRLLGEEMFEAP